tara:strand:- start:1995 stop:2672 length:678 start_codon:yes stop_codon:yes gene_type:complete
MRTERLFPTPIWIDDDCGIDPKEIEEFAYIVEKEDPKGVQASNYGGYQSDSFRDTFIPDPLSKLYQRLMANAYESADSFGFSNYTLKLSNLWMNINRKSNYNLLHTHAGCIMSGVYYAKVPECCSGDLKFVRDLNHQCLKEYWGCNENFDRYEHDYNYMEYYIQPKENLMILFPSWLMHSVDASSSDDDRISLSFNINIFSDYYRDNEIYPQRKSNNSQLSLKIN